VQGPFPEGVLRRHRDDRRRICRYASPQHRGNSPSPWGGTGQRVGRSVQSSPYEVRLSYQCGVYPRYRWHEVPVQVSAQGTGTYNFLSRIDVDELDRSVTVELYAYRCVYSIVLQWLNMVVVYTDPSHRPIEIPVNVLVQSVVPHLSNTVGCCYLYGGWVPCSPARNRIVV
jgi:hypothetical protein